MTSEDRAEVDLMIKEAFKYAAERVRARTQYTAYAAPSGANFAKLLRDLADELEKVAL